MLHDFTAIGMRTLILLSKLFKCLQMLFGMLFKLLMHEHRDHRNWWRDDFQDMKNVPQFPSCCCFKLKWWFSHIYDSWWWLVDDLIWCLGFGLEMGKIENLPSVQCTVWFLGEGCPWQCGWSSHWIWWTHLGQSRIPKHVVMEKSQDMNVCMYQDFHRWIGHPIGMPLILHQRFWWRQWMPCTKIKVVHNM